MPRRLIIGIGLLWIFASCAALGYELIRKPKLVIQWDTETEVNTAGFNLYRSIHIDGQYDRLNPSLIHGADDPLAGGKYIFTDENVEAGQVYYYQLEEVETDGRVNRIDVIQGRAPGVKYWFLALSVAGIFFGLVLVGKGLITIFRRQSKEAGDYSISSEPV